MGSEIHISSVRKHRLGNTPIETTSLQNRIDEVGVRITQYVKAEDEDEDLSGKACHSCVRAEQ